MKITEKINQVLADWNPIGVDTELAKEEYVNYIPLILQSINNKQQLIKCLEEIVDKMGIGYDTNNKKHSDDLQQICDKIILINQ